MTCLVIIAFVCCASISIFLGAFILYNANSVISSNLFRLLSLLFLIDGRSIVNLVIFFDDLEIL